MDALMLSRIQFAFTVGYHFIFVPISIGLALMVVFSERRYFKSGIPADKAASNFWIKLFTTTFAIGVATGLTMEFAFGTNWADYSRFVGSIFGAPLAAEGFWPSSSSRPSSACCSSGARRSPKASTTSRRGW